MRHYVCLPAYYVQGWPIISNSKCFNVLEGWCRWLLAFPIFTFHGAGTAVASLLKFLVSVKSDRLVFPN